MLKQQTGGAGYFNPCLILVQSDHHCIFSDTMEILFVLIGFSLLVALFFLGCFIWAVRTGQYEDRYTPAIRMLFENSQSGSTPSSKTSEE